MQNEQSKPKKYKGIFNYFIGNRSGDINDYSSGDIQSGEGGGIDENTLNQIVEDSMATDTEKPKKLGNVLKYLKDNPNFINWFSNANKYFSEPDGTPKVFFHGTNKDFDEFKQTKEYYKIDFPAFYFTENIEYANRYTNKSTIGGNIIPVVINAEKLFNTRNPEHLEMYKQSLKNDGWQEYEIETEIKDYFKEGLQHWTSHIALVIAKENGFDAALINERAGVDAVVIFNPKNVKSVFDKEFKPSSSKLIGEERLMEKNEPTNPKLWSRAKAAATRKFDKHSAYKMAWAAKWYKEKGGNWRRKKVNEYVEGMPQGENKVPFVKGAEKVEVKRDATLTGGKTYSTGDINAVKITKYEE